MDERDGKIVGTLYYKIPFRSVDRLNSKNILTILLIILILSSTVFAYNATIIPLQGDFENQNEIHLDNSLYLEYNNANYSNSKDNLNIFYNQNYTDLNVTINET